MGWSGATGDGWDAARAVVVVEGESDRQAVLALARRRGVQLQAAGVQVQVLGGVHAIKPYLRAHRARGDRPHLTGLYDAGEEAVVRRGLAAAGLGEPVQRSELEAAGFFCCDLDLEDELIRSLGAPRVCAVIAAHGDELALHGLQQQPQWRDQPIELQLRRFFGSGARRKIQYGRWLTEALELDRVPRGLDGVLRAAITRARADTAPDGSGRA